LYFHLHLRLPSGLLPSEFLKTICCHFLPPHSCYAPRLLHPSWFGEQYKLWSFPSCI